MILKITAKKEKPFIGDEGDEIIYFWYSGLREEDGATIKFGSLSGDYEVGSIVDILLEKSERIVDRKGKKITKYVYKEVKI